MQPIASTRPAGPSALWGRGFRPFFLLAALHAALFVPLWLAMLRGLVPLPQATAWLVAGVLWAGSFAFFVARYGPLLLRPRPDGEPG